MMTKNYLLAVPDSEVAPPFVISETRLAEEGLAPAIKVYRISPPNLHRVIVQRNSPFTHSYSLREAA